MYRIVVKNGTVLNPATGYCQKNDVAIGPDGKVIFIGEIPQETPEFTRLTNIIDASDCFIVPGLIDLHTHIYPLASFGISSEAACFASGVTTAMDCGSCGSENYDQRRGIIDYTRLTVKTLLHVSPSGVISGKITENADPSTFDEDTIRFLTQKYKGEILGLKIRMGKEIVGDLGLEPLKAAVRIGHKFDLPVMVHCTNPPGEMDDLLDMLDRNDILSHSYMDKGSTIVDENGHVKESAKRARARGVIFDVANANAHFGLKTAIPAISEGFLPDTISTDTTINSLYRRPEAFNLLHIMGKYMALGLSFNKVLECTTVNPAKWMGIEQEAGKIEVGCASDIAVLKIVENETCYDDYTNRALTGKRFIQNMMTIKNGVIVYRDQAF